MTTFLENKIKEFKNLPSRKRKVDMKHHIFVWLKVEDLGDFINITKKYRLQQNELLKIIMEDFLNKYRKSDAFFKRFGV